METAAVLPIFLLFLLTWFVFFDGISREMRSYSTLAEQVKDMASAGYLWTEPEMSELQTTYAVPMKITFFGKKEVSGYVRAGARNWNGCEDRNSGIGNQDSEMVYRTENGSVYHTDLNCSYLNPSVRAVSETEISSLRNESGEIYRACESCKASGGSCVYITDYGNRYHTSISCSALKRNIFAVPKSEVAGLPHCSKCAMQGGAGR